ncbi:MAG: bifunctional helix-turn-helix transcriptional regulator/GNAT family N-acetyltransferase [Janthinobacterium lividum]
MQPLENDLIDDIRASSRLVVRKLGFMQPTLAATDYPPSAVHALMEIGMRGSMTAGDATAFLALEKSSVSRLLRKLVDAGELVESNRAADARIEDLRLTAKGRRTRAAIEKFGRAQVSGALGALDAPAQEAVRVGLATYADALAGSGGTPPSEAAAARIAEGYRPGVIGRVTEMHLAFYERHCGFGQVFESQVAAGLAEFAGRLTSPLNGLWTAARSGRIVGSVAIDGEPGRHGKGTGAQLRWFIVDTGLRGVGVGAALLKEALDFCDRVGHAEVRLWTFKGLDAARKLYERNGFVLAEEHQGTQWGAPVMEQLFVRSSPAARAS